MMCVGDPDLAVRIRCYVTPMFFKDVIRFIWLYFGQEIRFYCILWRSNIHFYTIPDGTSNFYLQVSRLNIINQVTKHKIAT